MFIFYLCFLAGGMVLPIISAIAGFINGGVDTEVSPDTDVEVDVDSTGNGLLEIAFLPTSLMALSALGITFGAVGSIMSYADRSSVLTFIVALISGYFASVVIQTIMKSLKKVQTRYYGINENELMLYDGKIVDTILPGQLGTVSFTTLKNVSVSYPARCFDQTLKLQTGRIVKPTEFKDGIVIVKPKNKYE